MKTIKENVNAQISEKKSKFIADLIYVSSEEEAQANLEQIRNIMMQDIIVLLIAF